MTQKAPRSKVIARKRAQPPRLRALSRHPVLSYDLGGTKVAVGIVDPEGHVLEEIRVPVALEQGKAAVIQQLGMLGQSLIAQYPKVERVGIASAGPLDPSAGILLDPTNFSSPKGRWGNVPIAKLLSQKLKRPVALENDAAAAILAEHWVGCARGQENVMILTLGTGLGTGIIANGKLVRGGRGLHPEAGHMIIHRDDSSAPCGCGNLGCAEAYLSGRSFGRRARAPFGNANLSAQDIAELARKRDPRALAAFDEYAQLMAVAISNYLRLYYPEMVVFTGSFAQASDLFLEATHDSLKHLLRWSAPSEKMLPKLKVSSLNNQAGLVGGAYVALFQHTA